jgi:nitronate monooxygenase
MMSTRERVESFCTRFGLKRPILLAPMAGASAPQLSIAVAHAGGLGACGVLLMSPEEITTWCKEVRSHGGGAFQLNAWVPDVAPLRNEPHEAEVRAFLSSWGPPVPATAGNARPPDFEQQCQAMLAAHPPVISSVMGLFGPVFVSALKERGIAWFANVSTVSEARAAESAGADVVVAQGMEAGGHRASFTASEAERRQVGLIALLPAIADAVRVPVVAAGGIADPRAVAAALLLGASAVQIGTAFLRCPEANINQAWADALARTAPEDTVVSCVFSGRPGRSIATNYVRAAMAPGAPPPAAYPVQRGLTAAMRAAALAGNDLERMQAWAGQAAAMARAQPAARVVEQLWRGAQQLLGTP